MDQMTEDQKNWLAALGLLEVLERYRTVKRPKVIPFPRPFITFRGSRLPLSERLASHAPATHLATPISQTQAMNVTLSPPGYPSPTPGDALPVTDGSGPSDLRG